MSGVIRRIVVFYWCLRARVGFLRSGMPYPNGFEARGPVCFRRVGSGVLAIGNNALLVGSTAFNRVGVNHPPQIVVGDGARLVIGEEFKMTGGSIFCTLQIHIGDHVLFGANSKVFDNDFHPLDWKGRREKGRPEEAPVIIGDDVWLGADVTVLKGVRIGARTVVAAGSVVTKDLPSDCLAAGIPAKPVRQLSSESL